MERFLKFPVIICYAIGGRVTNGRTIHIGNDVTHSTLLPVDRACACSYENPPKYRSYRVTNTAPGCPLAQPVSRLGWRTNKLENQHAPIQNLYKRLNPIWNESNRETDSIRFDSIWLSEASRSLVRNPPGEKDAPMPGPKPSEPSDSHSLRSFSR